MEVTTAHPGERDTRNPTSERRIGGRYVLRTTIGAGGMGTVWRARDELLRRDVAVKEVLLPPGLPEAEREMLCERTLREARAAAALNHPSVIRVFDVVNDDNRPWIVMELLEARSLADIIREDGPLPPRTVAAIGLAVLGALEAAHVAGVLHRDIKPGNVMVAPDGRTTLTDFGVASAPGDSSLTSTGLLLGSPQYIAPERARGQAFGPASDLFSLGATLYAAVQGKPPFDRGDPLPTLTAVVGEDPDPMPQAGPLEPVLTGLLVKSPTERFTHAQARKGLLSVLGTGLNSDTDSDAARRAALVAQTVQHTPSPLPGAQPSATEVPAVPAVLPGVTPLAETAPSETPPDATMQVPLPAAEPAAPAPEPQLTPSPTTALPVTPQQGFSYGVADPRSYQVIDTTQGQTAYQLPPQQPTEVTYHPPVSPSGPPPPLPPAAPSLSPRQPGNRRTLVLAGVAALVIVLVIGITGVVVGMNLSRGNPEPKASAQAIPLTLYTDEDGFQVKVPAGWKQQGNSPVRFYDATGKVWIQVYSEHAGSSEQKKVWESGSRRQQRGVAGTSGYQLVGYQNTQMGSFSSVDWEWTYQRDGEAERRHALYRGVVVDGRSYQLALSAPESQFAARRPVLDQVAATFKLGS
ncbi:serine/threonine-protein kinase [Fodinicola acaciae]|uniref:serine/threonine-protein kinase n=1 Tax=Fodinicola acaciae TaxID=2681555 RepID=UPI0013D18B12|nr:serine/threonine-protein kinase [Fodinicola acaciae]